ncbi:MAG: hypothetical protein AB7Q45_04465, partial [Planctomycetaceae bacterium]
ACMRKLLVILNTLLKTNTPWNPQLLNSSRKLPGQPTQPLSPPPGERTSAASRAGVPCRENMKFHLNFE